jgi:hypothetical protein
MRCKLCNTETPSDDKYCRRCGFLLESSVDEASTGYLLDDKNSHVQPRRVVPLIDNEINREYEAAQKRKNRIIWLSNLLVATIGIIATIIAGIIPILPSFGTTEAKPLFLNILGIAVGSILTLVISALLVMLLRRRSSKVISLRRKLKGAFLQALDNSSINPNLTVGDGHVRHYEGK